MPAAKRGRRRATASSGRKPGATRSGRVYKLYALGDDGNELTYLADSPPTTTGQAAVLAAVKEGTVEAGVKIVPLPESALSATEIEAQEIRETVYTIKASDEPKRRGGRRRRVDDAGEEETTTRRATKAKSANGRRRSRTASEPVEKPTAPAPEPPEPPATPDNPFTAQAE